MRKGLQRHLFEVKRKRNQRKAHLMGYKKEHQYGNE